jgi:transcriptional regulator with AAA-type ATPase domain
MGPIGGGTGETTQRAEDGRSGSTLGRPELAVAWIAESGTVELSILRGARLKIGRDKSAQIRLDHPSVSRLHAELYRQGPIYVLQDLESTNGTWLDDARAEHAAISAGCVLRVGDCIGVVLNLEPGVDEPAFANLAPGLWGGPTLSAAVRDAKTAATTNVPIVLVGETGTGKERIARALHGWSGRSGPFHAIGCSTVSPALAEAELFGHQRGAFPGAESSRRGHLLAAHRGTLFLDEIADLTLEVQAKLLRAVETGEVSPLGGTGTTLVDVRIIVATFERLEALVEQKRFRPDLAARLAGFVVQVPALRERREEIPGLFASFLRKHSTGSVPRVSPALFEWLCLRDWPGNVRELELLARKLVALHAFEPLLRVDHAEPLCDGPAAPRARPSRQDAPLSGTQRAFRDRRESDFHRLKHALERTDGNLKAAAESIGISRRRAYRLIEAAKRETTR